MSNNVDAWGKSVVESVIKNIKSQKEDMFKLGFLNKLSASDLNRNKIISILRKYVHPEMEIGGGSAMVLHGLRSNTQDIDAAIGPPEFQNLLDRYKGKVETALSGDRMFNIPGTPIDVHERSVNRSMVESMPGVKGLVTRRKALLKFYKNMNRPKDQKWIKILEDIK